LASFTSSRRGSLAARWPLLLTVVTALAPVHAADDALVQPTEAESTKVGPVATDTVRDGAAPPVASATHGGARPVRPAPSRDFFEALLRRQYVGTHSVYRRLPERSRDEVFLDYSAGASIETLRDKIIDRFLHP